MRTISKKAFTMIEIIVVISIIALLASLGIKKFIISKQEAKTVAVAKDIGTIRDAIMTHYYLKDSSLNAISDVVQLNPKIWTSTNGTKVAFIDDNSECVSIAIVKSTNNEKIVIDIDETLGGICNRIKNLGVSDYEFILKGTQ